MPLADEDTAIAAITSLSELSDEQKAAHSQIHEIISDSNPFVDIHQLFGLYNILYFRSLLLPRVEVTWSARLTLCAGICELVKDDEGKYRRIRLKLSEPLLKYRPRSDTIDTLLHEAIHAYFFITTSWRHARGDDGTGHGNGFLLLADAINNHGNYEITVYHTFHDEVDSYRTHVWRCDGPCQQRPPYFGLVKRTMNRPPSKGDTWWKKHEEECGGTYIKIMEPELTKAQLKALSAKDRAGLQKNKIDSWIKKPDRNGSHRCEKPRQISPSAFCESKSDFGSVSATKDDPASRDVKIVSQQKKRKLSPDVEEANVLSKQPLITCPICDKMMSEREINRHLDEKHTD